MVVLHGGAEMLGQVLDARWTAILGYLRGRHTDLAMRVVRKLAGEGTTDTLARHLAGVPWPQPFVVPARALPTELQIAYNGVGGAEIDALRPSYRAALRESLQHARHVSVRDLTTQQALLRLGIEAELSPDSAVVMSRAFERDYRARLRGFVEGQLKALEDAAPSGPVAPPQPPGLGGNSRPLPGADDLPALSTGARQTSYSALRDSGSDQLGQARGIDRSGCRREPVTGARPVEPHQGVEMDRSTHLVLRDLGVLHRRHLGQPVRRHLLLLGDQPVQRGGEPTPQVREPPEADHGARLAVERRRRGTTVPRRYASLM
jgi:hypothetical protein